MRRDSRFLLFAHGSLLLLIGGLLLPANIVDAQVASPAQAGHYAGAVMNVRDLATPPPGLFIQWYNWYPWTNEYADRNGDKLTSLRLSQVDPDLPDTDIDISGNGFATVPALIYSSTFTVLGGARFFAAISPNWLIANYTVLADPGGTGYDSTAVIEGSVSGISDLFVSPLGLSWALGVADVTITYGFTAPTGRYTTGADDNIGLGFWTHQFQGFGYYYPVADQSTAAMVGLTYEINSRIEDVDVSPGSRITLEWGLSQYVSERLELAVQGGHNFQIGDDSGGDVFWDTSYRDRKSTIGISAGYWPWKNRLNVIAKYAFDFGVRQGFVNQSVMLNLLFITNALTGE